MYWFCTSGMEVQPMVQFANITVVGNHPLLSSRESLTRAGRHPREMSAGNDAKRFVASGAFGGESTADWIIREKESARPHLRLPFAGSERERGGSFSDWTYIRLGELSFAANVLSEACAR